MNECRDGVELPAYGACPVCGAYAYQECRTKSYVEFMKLEAARKNRQVGAELPKDWNRDRRRSLSSPKQGGEP